MANNGVLTDKSREPGPNFTLGNRLKRMLWWFVYVLLFRFTPQQLHVWRIMLLRLFGADIGKNCHLYPRVVIWVPWNLIKAVHNYE